MPEGPIQVLFDDQCPMCLFQAGLLERLDRRGRLRMVPISSGETPTILPSVDRSELMAAMHVVTPEGKFYRGARSIRYLSGRLPILWPLAAILWIPGVIYLAEIVYRLVARNRYLLSKLFGCLKACGIIRPKESDRTSQT